MARPARVPLFHHSRFPILDSRGFTLIELLVVVVIVGILAAALALSLGGSSERELANTAERFQALLGHACSEAELSGREIGVAVGTDGYAFSRLDGDAWRAFGKDDELRARRWPAGLRLEFTRGGRPLELATPEQAQPQLVCFSSGELTPFALVLALGDAPARYRISGGEDGSLKMDKL
ncbi:MAG: type II secretion system minor pseudopilin GspH [Rhodanobacteraceae bacterium]|jgi:general secretion pathway protein H|nr:type II secretion system minor pseudopilin GspH [Rhodanobacteraceae bacterium]